MDLASLLPFDPHSAPSSICQRWQVWRRRFKTYLPGLNNTNATKQRAPLLYQDGQAAQEMFDTIPENSANDDYAIALDKLDEHSCRRKASFSELFTAD